jgi:hypothetical protein
MHLDVQLFHHAWPLGFYWDRVTFVKELTTMEISKVIQKDNWITVFGSHFGNRGYVWIESLAEGEKGKEINIEQRAPIQLQIDVTKYTTRDDKRIASKLDCLDDTIRSELKQQKYYIRVEKNGSVTPTNSKAIPTTDGSAP